MQLFQESTDTAPAHTWPGDCNSSCNTTVGMRTKTLNEQLRVPWDWTDFDDGVLVAYCWPDPETETPGPWQLARWSWQMNARKTICTQISYTSFKAAFQIPCVQVKRLLTVEYFKTFQPFPKDFRIFSFPDIKWHAEVQRLRFHEWSLMAAEKKRPMHKEKEIGKHFLLCKFFAFFKLQTLTLEVQTFYVFLLLRITPGASLGSHFRCLPLQSSWKAVCLTLLATCCWHSVNVNLWQRETCAASKFFWQSPDFKSPFREHPSVHTQNYKALLQLLYLVNCIDEGVWLRCSASIRCSKPSCFIIRMYLYMIDLRVLRTPILWENNRNKILQCPKHDFSDPGIETAQEQAVGEHCRSYARNSQTNEVWQLLAAHNSEETLLLFCDDSAKHGTKKTLPAKLGDFMDLAKCWDSSSHSMTKSSSDLKNTQEKADRSALTHRVITW